MIDECATEGGPLQRLAEAGLRVVPVLLCLTMLAACSETQFLMQASKKVASSDDAKGKYKVGNPYQIDGVWYYPAEDYDYDETGIASWYGPGFHGKATANGDVYDQNDLTAAHKTLPMPSVVRVTNLENGRSIVVKINDRGPYARGRILDGSRRVAQLLGYEQKGTARVRVQILAEESQQLASQLKGQTLLASGTPITSAPIPKASVKAESLAPPPGVTNAAPAPATVVIGTPPAPPVRLPEIAPSQALDTVSLTPVKPTTLYIQAGAFSQMDNANRVVSKLKGIANVVVSPTQTKGKPLYRVRVGPINDTDQADKLLDRVIKAGYSDARVVVD
jgi:rare lipoprotein A